MKKIKIILLICLCVIFYSCTSDLKKRNKIVFESEDGKILVYENELDYEFQQSFEESGANPKSLTKEEISKIKKQIVEKIALRRAIAIEGKKQKIHRTQKYKDGINGSNEAFMAWITMGERSKNIDITERELRDYYENNKENYIRREDTVRLQLIVLDNIKKAEEILDEVLNNKEKFNEIVRKYTISSDEFNGETGEIPKSVLNREYPEISKVIENLLDGDIAKNIVLAGNEIYIVKVLEKLPRGFIQFDRVKKDIYQELLLRERNLKNQYFIDEIKNKYKLNNVKLEDLKISE